MAENPCVHNSRDDLELLTDVSISSESLITQSDSENVNCSKGEESNTDIDDQAVECDHW